VGWRRTRPAPRWPEHSAAGCDALRRAVNRAAGQRRRPRGAPPCASSCRLRAVLCAQPVAAPPPCLAVPSSESRLSASATRPRAAAERAKTPRRRTGGRRLQAPGRGQARPGEGGRAGHGSRAALCGRLLAPLAAGAPAQRPHRALRTVSRPSAAPATDSEGRRHESDRVLREDPGGRAVRRWPHESFQPHPAGGDPLPEGRGQGEWPGARGGERTGERRGDQYGASWRRRRETGRRGKGKCRSRRPRRRPRPGPAAVKFSARSGWAAIATLTVPGHCLGPPGLGVDGRVPRARTGRGRVRHAGGAALPGGAPLPDRPRALAIQLQASPGAGLSRRVAHGTLGSVGRVERSGTRGSRSRAVDLLCSCGISESRVQPCLGRPGSWAKVGAMEWLRCSAP
jgi:hypothetical protein